MKFKIKILSPVHIGSGEIISKTEYLIVNNKFVRLNMESLIQDKDIGLSLNNLIMNATDGNSLKHLLRGKEKLVLERHALYTIPLEKSTPADKEIQVASFIKTAGRAYIPGSSLKGAILSGVLFSLLAKSKQATTKVMKKFQGQMRTQIFDQAWNSRNYDEIHDFAMRCLEKNKPETVGRFLHWLDVSDSSLNPSSDVLELSNAKVENKKRGIASEIPLFYETLKPDSEFEVDIKMPRQDSKLGQPHSPQLEEMLSWVKDFYNKVATKENVQLSYSEKSLPIRIGQGSGVWPVSFLLLAEDLNIPYTIPRPRIRGRELPSITPQEGPWTKKTIGGKSMGWALLAPMT